MAPNVLKENASVPFVKRILEPEKYPVKKNPDGSISTHLMGSAQIDGRHFAFPTLRLQGDDLVEDKSPMTAYRTGNVVFFDTAEEADEFARGSWKSMVSNNFFGDKSMTPEENRKRKVSSMMRGELPIKGTFSVVEDRKSLMDGIDFTGDEELSKNEKIFRAKKIIDNTGGLNQEDFQFLSMGDYYSLPPIRHSSPIRYGRYGIPLMIDSSDVDSKERVVGFTDKGFFKSTKEDLISEVAHYVNNARSRGVPEEDIREYFGLDKNPDFIGVDFSDPQLLRSKPPGDPTLQTGAYQTRDPILSQQELEEASRTYGTMERKTRDFGPYDDYILRHSPQINFPPQENTLRTRMDEMKPPQEPITFSELLSPFVKVRAQDFTPERESKSKRGFVNANEAFDFSSLSDK